MIKNQSAVRKRFLAAFFSPRVFRNEAHCHIPPIRGYIALLPKRRSVAVGGGLNTGNSDSDSSIMPDCFWHIIAFDER
jgi:hypothetical protein